MAAEYGASQGDAAVGSGDPDAFRILLAWDARPDGSGMMRICLYREPDGRYCCEYQHRDRDRGVWRDVLSEEEARAFYATLRTQVVAFDHAFS